MFFSPIVNPFDGAEQLACTLALQSVSRSELTRPDPQPLEACCGAMSHPSAKLVPGEISKAYA
jgi:hypothetical protein